MILCFLKRPFCLVTVNSTTSKLSLQHAPTGSYLPAVALGGGGGGGALVNRRGSLVDWRRAPLLRAHGAPVIVLVMGHADEAPARHYALQMLSILWRLPRLSVGFSSGEQGEGEVTIARVAVCSKGSSSASYRHIRGHIGQSCDPSLVSAAGRATSCGPNNS